MILVDHQFYSEGGNYYLLDSCYRGYVTSFSLLSSLIKRRNLFLKKYWVPLKFYRSVYVKKHSSNSYENKNDTIRSSKTFPIFQI
jgi:hypothetical protein